jgi:hypothetical protein
MAKRLVVNLTMTIDIVDDASNGEHEATSANCVLCGWSRAYKSSQSARRGLAAHLALCPKKGDSVARSNEIIGQWMDELTKRR